VRNEREKKSLEPLYEHWITRKKEKRSFPKETTKQGPSSKKGKEEAKKTLSQKKEKPNHHRKENRNFRAVTSFKSPGKWG